MTKLSRLSLPRGRLKMVNSGTPRMATTLMAQCFSITIVIVVITTVIIDATAAAAVENPAAAVKLPTTVVDEESTAAQGRTIISHPQAHPSILPAVQQQPPAVDKQEVADGNATRVESNQLMDELPVASGGGGEDGTSHILGAFSTTTTATTMTMGSSERTMSTKTTAAATTIHAITSEEERGRRRQRTRADEAELFPQNDQPHRNVLPITTGGLDTLTTIAAADAVSGYDNGQQQQQHNKMSNGTLDGDGSGPSHQQQQQQPATRKKKLWSRGVAHVDIQCPSLKENSACPCYKFDDGLVLECPSTTAFSLRTTLQLITAPIQSLSVYDFDRSVTTLTQDVFSSGAGLHIRHLQFSQSHLEVVADNALRGIANSLESLSLVNGRLKRIPQRPISEMDRLTMLDLEANEIGEVAAESFAGLHLTKLNLKSNRIAALQPNAFKGVEMTLTEIDLSDNRLQAFPLVVLRQLDNLRSLRLALNEMAALIWDGHTRLASLQFLDLSSNKFTELGEHFFAPFAKLKTLSFYSNALHTVHHKAFQGLRELVSVDISHNHLIALDSALFAANKKLQTVDLSHNHLHYVDDMFTNLPHLREVFLGENNILELSRDVFTNSTRITHIYLEQNAIRRVDGDVLETLKSLQQLHLSHSFIGQLPRDFLRAPAELTSLSMEGNWLAELERGLFHSLVKLRELRLHGNRIREVHGRVFHTLPALVELHLQGNLISAIELDAFVSLASLLHLNLQNNRLHRLEMVLPNGALTTVQVDGNRLTGIEETVFRGQPHLQVLSLANNQLTALHRDLLADLSGLERLMLVNNSIESLQPETFQNATALRVIDLTGNSLTEIKRHHFSPHLANLEELVLRGNRIQLIEAKAFDKLAKLRLIDLSGNFLATLSKDMFQDNLQINTVSLQAARVSHIEDGTFRNMNHLYELNLEENSLRAEDVRQLEVPSLRMLRLSNNPQLSGSSTLLDGVFDKLPSLQILRMANCNIHELPELIFVRNTNLVRIELSHNRIRSLPRSIFSGLNVLKELRLVENKFSEFPHNAFYNISALEILALSQNQLTSFDFSKLNGLPSIRHVDLSDNLISSMSGFSATNITQLEFLDLSGNFLLSLPSNFFLHSIKLQRIDLSRNRFQHIPSNALGDNSLPRLTWLNLSGNPLIAINQPQQSGAVGFAFLKELHIRRTNLSIITSQDFDAFPALQQLQMTHSKLFRISPGAFKGLANLLGLDLSLNELEKVHTERLQGLKLLRSLNLSHNVLKELEDFPEDLRQLRQLDLSFNQLGKLNKASLRHLASLTELHLMGNRLKAIATEAFRSVVQLQVLDLRKNYFEHIPLQAIQVAEAHLKELRIEDNPIQCSCDTQELWEWLRNHLKLKLSPMNRNTDGTGGNMLVSLDAANSHGKHGRQRPDAHGGGYPDDMEATTEFLGDEQPNEVALFSNHLRCDQPESLRGRTLMQMEPHRFCDAPLILKMAIEDVQPYAVHVSWQTREHSGLHGYHVVYRTVEPSDSDEVRSVTLDRWAKSAKLFKLAPATKYQICIVGIANIWGHNTPFAGDHLVQPLSSTSYYSSAEGSSSSSGGSGSGSQTSVERNSLESLLSNNVTSKCEEVVTLTAELSLMMDEQGMAVSSYIQSLLTRRLGLIIGCCLGIIVFIVLIVVLGWLKVKKKRLMEETKRLDPHPPEFISYQPYCIAQQEEEQQRQQQLAAGVPGHHHQHHHLPQYGMTLQGGGGGTYVARGEFANGSVGGRETEGGSGHRMDGS